jgi:hypothetical protein
MFRYVRQDFKVPEYRPSGEFPPPDALQALKYEHMISCSSGSSPFKNQVLVRFNHIIYIR